MPWNLFDYAPCKCYHPALVGLEPYDWFPAMVVKVGDSQVVIFDLNYMMGPDDDIPGSGRAYVPYEGVSLSFDEKTDEWHMTEPVNRRGEARLFRFTKPDSDLQKLFNKNRDQIPSQEAMLETASYEFLD